ncbi:MAG: hypothetical protein AB7O59_25400 [Pirellulales bacterium]
MLRRALAIVFSTMLLLSLAARAASPPPVDGGGVTGLDLKTQLEKGLKARRPVEFEYIAEIVKLVEKEELPRQLVTTTYQWAQRQPTRQLQYFQFALQARARGLKVTLPDLSKQAVGNSTNGRQSGVTH